MNGDATSSGTRFGPELVVAYEQLRSAATESRRHGANLQGLGILISRGMAAWMQICATVAPPTTSPSPVIDDARLPASAQRDVVDVLAAMALTITTEVRT